MYYRKNKDNTILDYSEVRYADNCSYTEEAIVKSWDGIPYLESECPQMPKELLEAQIQKQMTDAVQYALDAFAKTRGYDGIMSACSYSNSTDAQFKLEADYCIQLRDTTWRMGYAILAEVKAGNRPVPTVEELIAELPVGSAKWPDEA